MTSRQNKNRARLRIARQKREQALTAEQVETQERLEVLDKLGVTLPEDKKNGLKELPKKVKKEKVEKVEEVKPAVEEKTEEV